MNAIIHPCSVADVKPLLREHYLHKRPGTVILCLRMLVNWEPVGVITFSLPPPETQKRYGCLCWELSRLYIKDGVGPNSETWFIGKAIKYVRAKHRDVKALISYADPSAHHVGTIYRASNWERDGRTDDDRKSPRVDLADAVTGKKFSRWNHVPPGTEVVRVPRVSKFRYVYWL